MARNGQEVISRGRNKVGRGRDKLGRGRKGQVEVENDQVGPGRVRTYSPVPTRTNYGKQERSYFNNLAGIETII